MIDLLLLGSEPKGPVVKDLDRDPNGGDHVVISAFATALPLRGT